MAGVQRRAIRTWVEIREMIRDGEGDSAGNFVRGEPGEDPHSTNNRFDDSA